MGEAPEGKGSRTIRDPDSRCGEHPTVDGSTPDSPLSQGQPGDRHEQRVKKRQQDDNGKLPDRINVLDDAFWFTQPSGKFDRGCVARCQHAKSDQVVRVDGQYGCANRDRRDVDKYHRDDENDQGARQLGYRPGLDLKQSLAQGWPEGGIHRVLPWAP